MLRKGALPGARPAARRGGDAGPAAPAARFLCFTVAGIPMAMDLGAVQEVTAVPPLLPIPRPAGPAEALALVRGRPVLVVDLRRRLGLVNPVTDHRARLIVTAGLPRPWAFLVDAATEILASEGPASGPGEAGPGAGLRGDLFAGALEARGARIFLPDFAKILAAP